MARSSKARARSSSAGRALRAEHFKRIQPVCPTCRSVGRDTVALTLGRVVRERDGNIIEGALLCPANECQREHPIIDGIPIIVADARVYLSHQLDSIIARHDLSLFAESLLGDCADADSDLERRRHQLSSYARGHYGDLDPGEPAPAAGGLLALLDKSIELMSAPPSGLWLDSGCAVGRTAFELAARTGELVLGVDLNFAMLQLGRRVAETGRVSHPIRRVGRVFDRREFDVDFAHRDKVELWACDATGLPFADDHFAGGCSLNVIDCIASPMAHLSELGRVLRPGAEAILATPYDWSEGATPIEAWIGGHSQRSDHRGSSAREVRRLLSDASPAELGLRLAAELDRWPWNVYVHERASMTYEVHLMIAKAIQ